MRPVVLKPFLIVSLALCLLPLAQSQEPADPLARLEWLCGDWEGTLTLPGGHQQRILASYSSPAGGEILSWSKAFDSEGRLAFLEFERFRVQEGQVVLVPHPGGEAATPFLLSSCRPGRAVFLSPQNEWPQRVVYEIDWQDRLCIRADNPGEEASVLRILLSPAQVDSPR